MNIESQNQRNGDAVSARTPSNSLPNSLPNGVFDHFADVGVARTYAIDKAELEACYLERSKQVHPDKFVGADAATRVEALSASMQLNESYKVLKSDKARAEHLLALLGASIGGNEQLDPSFLMSILEAREELADAQASGDSKAVMRLEESMLDRKESALETIASLFARVETAETAATNKTDKTDKTDKPAALGEIKRELIVLRYIDRYLEAAVSDID